MRSRRRGSTPGTPTTAGPAPARRTARATTAPSSSTPAQTAPRPDAVRLDREHPVPDGCIDHLWLRVRDPAASKRFYMTIAPYAGLHLGIDEPDHVQLRGEGFGFSLIKDDRPLTEHVHIAFPTR